MLGLNLEEFEEHENRLLIVTLLIFKLAETQAYKIINIYANTNHFRHQNEEKADSIAQELRLLREGTCSYYRYF